MALYRVLALFWAMAAIGSCARNPLASPTRFSASPLSPIEVHVSISPLPMPDIHSPVLYSMDTDLEAVALRPEDFPFMKALYVLRTEIQDSLSHGVELRYPAQEDRFHPFVKGWAVELRVFLDARSAWEAYTRRVSGLAGSSQPLVTSADTAQLNVYTSLGPGSETVWVQEVVFWRGNLLGYLIVKWSEPLDKRFFEERINLILQRLGRP